MNEHRIIKATRAAELGMAPKEFLMLEQLEETNAHLKAIEEKEMPAHPEVQRVSLEGIEVITLKGDKGEPGQDGKDGEPGPQGIQGVPGKDGKDGRDGIDGIDGRDGRDGVDGKDGAPGKDGSPDTPEQIKEKLDSIQYLRDELKAIKDEMASIPRMQGMRKIPIVKRVRLTPQVDGVARSFVLPKDTVAIIALDGTSFPATFDDVDWTLAGNTLTLAENIPTPEAGQTLIAIIETLFY